MQLSTEHGEEIQKVNDGKVERKSFNEDYEPSRWIEVRVCANACREYYVLWKIAL